MMEEDHCVCQIIGKEFAYPICVCGWHFVGWKWYEDDCHNQNVVVLYFWNEGHGRGLLCAWS